jgi:hypothetical protein
MKNLYLFSTLVIACPLLASQSGCSFDADDWGASLGQGLGCLLYLGSYSPTESDNERLRASVTCTEGSDCADKRTIHRGAKMDFVISIQSELADGPFEVASDPPGLLEIKGFTDEAEECDDGREVSGSVKFSGEGEGALVVLSGGKELDRFSVDVQKPALVQIQYSEEGPFGSFHTLESITLEQEGALRALTRGSTGDRLVGGPAVQWSLPDTKVAGFDEGAASFTGAVALIHPAVDGETVVSVTVGKLEAEVPIVVGEAEGMGGADRE